MDMENNSEAKQMQTENQAKWQNNSVNKARRNRKSGRLLDFCYRAAHGGEKPIFYSEESFKRFCAASRKIKIGGEVNDDCLGCGIKGIPGNVEIRGVAA